MTVLTAQQGYTCPDNTERGSGLNTQFIYSDVKQKKTPLDSWYQGEVISHNASNMLRETNKSL